MSVLKKLARFFLLQDSLARTALQMVYWALLALILLTTYTFLAGYVRFTIVGPRLFYKPMVTFEGAILGVMFFLLAFGVLRVVIETADALMHWLQHGKPPFRRGKERIR